MNKINLSVDDVNLETVLTILNSLKSGLIVNMEVNGKVKETRYQPKTNSVIYENESGTNDTSGKYSSSAYRERLKKNSQRYFKTSTPTKIIPKNRNEDIKTKAVTTLGEHS